MLDMAFAFDLEQVVKNYTRIEGDSKSILHLFFLSGSITAQTSSEVITGVSDHSAVLLELTGVALQSKNLMNPFPNFSRADDVSIIDTLVFFYDIFSSFSGDINGLCY